VRRARREFRLTIIFIMKASSAGALGVSEHKTLSVGIYRENRRGSSPTGVMMWTYCVRFFCLSASRHCCCYAFQCHSFIRCSHPIEGACASVTASERHREGSKRCTRFALTRRQAVRSGRKIISTLPDETGKPRNSSRCQRISERKQKEELLRESEARLQFALDAGGRHVGELAREWTNYRHGSRVRMHGLPPEPNDQDKGWRLSIRTPAKVKQALHDTLETAHRSMSSTASQHQTVRALAGLPGDLRETGGQRRLIGLLRELSRRKASEATIQTSQIRLQLALDAARSAVALTPAPG